MTPPSTGLRKRYLAVYSPVNGGTRQKAELAATAFKTAHGDVDVSAQDNGNFLVKCKQPSLLPTTFDGFEQTDVIDTYAARLGDAIES